MTDKLSKEEIINPTYDFDFSYQNGNMGGNSDSAVSLNGLRKPMIDSWDSKKISQNHVAKEAVVWFENKFSLDIERIIRFFK